MRLELYDKNERCVIGQSESFRPEDWAISNEKDEVWNLIPLTVTCHSGGTVEHGKLMFDTGRRTRLKINLPQGMSQVVEGMVISFEPRSLSVTRNNWERGLRKGTQAVGMALHHGHH